MPLSLGCLRAVCQTGGFHACLACGAPAGSLAAGLPLAGVSAGGAPRAEPVKHAVTEAADYFCMAPDGNFNAWLQITNVFCCGTLIKLLLPAGVLWCCEWSGLPARPRSPSPAFRCKSALYSFLIIALHPALGFQRHPANSVCSGCNLDYTLFVLTTATRYNFAVLFKFHEFQCVLRVPIKSSIREEALAQVKVAFAVSVKLPLKWKAACSVVNVLNRI